MSGKTCAAGILAAALSVGPALAADQLYVPLLTYRTGAFAGSGIPIADGMHDYLAMLNQRDGGIGGVKIAIEECETGYDAQKGVECYESTKGKGALVYNPYSTGITLQLIPKAAVDKVPILSMAYGLSAAAVGDTFPWVFNAPVTYWDGASAILEYIAEQEGGLDKLQGKKIGFIYLDAGYGREPIPLFEGLAPDVEPLRALVLHLVGGDGILKQFVAVFRREPLEQRERLAAIARVEIDEADLLALQLVEAAFLLADIFENGRRSIPVGHRRVEDPWEGVADRGG